MNLERVTTASLHLDPANARKHGDKNLAAIKASLARFGQQQPIVVGPNNVVVVGNGRLQAALELGWNEITIVRTSLNGADLLAYAIADNRTAELAEWDDSVLAKLIEALKATDLIDATGFDAQDVKSILAEAAKVAMGDACDQPAPDAPDAAVSRAGDIWTLGRHRLMCGDSSKRDQLDALLGGQKIHLVNTDPPYNVKVEPRSNNAIAAGLSSFSATTPKGAHHQGLDLARHPEKSRATNKKLRAKDRPLANDFVTEEAFEQLLFDWFGNIAHALIDGGAFYIWGGYANVANYPPALVASKLYFSQAIIWNKLHPVLTRKDFMGAHEWCFYGWKEGAAHRWFGPTNATDLWEVKKVNPQAMVHLTEKPVELAVRAIEYSSQAGENVLDLFGGSGSTLMGAEKTGRHAFLMELDTLYCDVIIQRWQKATGGKATCNGVAYEDLARERGVVLEPVP